MRDAQLTDSSIEIEDERETKKPVIIARSVYSDRLGIVKSVIRAYLAVQERPSISAHVLDLESRQSRWTPVGAEYLADVEGTLRRFLKDRYDRIELREAWENLLADNNPTNRDAERRLVMGLAPLFQHNKLNPVDYFKTIKKRRLF